MTPNVWSHSGINQEVINHNVVRFVRNGSIIRQNEGEAPSTTTYTDTGGGNVTVSANLTNAYSRNSCAVQSGRRSLEYAGDVLRVHDRYIVATDVTPVFQLHVPVAPVVQGDGTIVAGSLRVTPPQP